VLCGCQKPEQVPGPLGLPPLMVDRKASPELVALGKLLFFDPKLSVDGKISCSSCHNPETGFADARKVSQGVAGRAGKRNAPTVLNAAYWKRQFWDGRAGSLEEQAAGPISNELEMNHTPEALLARLNADSTYVKAFGGGTIRMKQVLEAIAAYERTLLSGNSPADRYMYGGDKSALSDTALHGLKIFGRHCVACHSINNNYGLYTDQLFHNVGVGVNSEGELTDLGRGRGEFRTPSLRNVARTAPYMHDGSLKTLREVVDFYIGGGNSNPHLDPLIRPLDLSNEDRDGLIAFLEALNGDLPK
jgi:cytochrome c peroxidase